MQQNSMYCQLHADVSSGARSLMSRSRSLSTPILCVCEQLS